VAARQIVVEVPVQGREPDRAAGTPAGDADYIRAVAAGAGRLDLSARSFDGADETERQVLADRSGVFRARLASEMVRAATFPADAHLSHDHFDHLDRDTVVALAARTSMFLAPLGVGDQLVRWGIPPGKTQQLDWWQTAEVEGIQFTATPAQHFSGRSMFAKNPTLWASWSIYTGTHRIFFSGDSGYFDGFAEIGRRHGPFDLTLLEAGAYDKQWEGVHMLPEQVIQAHRDLRGQWLLPIHNATFDLAFHAWDEPMEKMFSLSAQHGILLTMPRIGEPVRLGHYQAAQPWWRFKQPRSADVSSTAASHAT
jgi:L-ascorbate metabolism protein UlaG (beta-lactamase superfamily)